MQTDGTSVDNDVLMMYYHLPTPVCEMGKKNRYPSSRLIISILSFALIL